MSQRVILGENACRQIPFLIRRLGLRKLLFVVGQSHQAFIRENNFIQNEARIIIVPEGILTTQVIDDILEQVSFPPEVVIAIGGGRILDAAKLLLYQSSFSRPYFVAIPTTAGSGSEATHFAVLYHGSQKTSVQHHQLLPDHVFLDPLLLDRLPKQQKAVSVVDALTQCVESLWNIHANDISKTYAAQGFRILWNGCRDYTQTNDGQLNKQMIWASFLSGKAIAITKTTGCHALSYYLTANHNVPHGQAVGFFLPLFFVYNGNAIPEILWQEMGFRTPEEGCEKMQQLIASCGLATNFKLAGLEVNISQLLDSVNEERFANNPVAFDREKLKDLIEQYLC